MLTGSNIIWLLIPVYVGIPVIWLWRVVRACARNQDAIQSSWSDLDVALLRKHDLVVKLVETARPLVDADRSLASDVTHLREIAVASRWNVKDHARDERKLDQAIVSLIGAAKRQVEASDGRFLRDLDRELSSSARHIQVAASTYNVAVHRYNTMLKTFPYSLIGKRLQLKPKPMYDSPAPDGARVRPTAGAFML